MITNVEEMRRVREIYAECLSDLARRGPRRTAERRARRDDRGAGRRAARAPAHARGRLRLDRHQRPDPVHAGRRPRQPQGRVDVRAPAPGRAAVDPA